MLETSKWHCQPLPLPSVPTDILSMSHLPNKAAQSGDAEPWVPQV